MLTARHFHLISNDPLSRFPQGGKALHDTPSPVGEGWEGGNNYFKIYCFSNDLNNFIPYLP